MLTVYDMDGMWRVETTEEEWRFGTRPMLLLVDQDIVVRKEWKERQV